jgi:PII-like signaling protein
MKKESNAILLRIFISESDKYEGKPLSKYLIGFFQTRRVGKVHCIKRYQRFW